MCVQQTFMCFCLHSCLWSLRVGAGLSFSLVSLAGQQAPESVSICLCLPTLGTWVHATLANTPGGSWESEFKSNAFPASILPALVDMPTAMLSDTLFTYNKIPY